MKKDKTPRIALLHELWLRDRIVKKSIIINYFLISIVLILFFAFLYCSIGAHCCNPLLANGTIFIYLIVASLIFLLIQLICFTILCSFMNSKAIKRLIETASDIKKKIKD